MKLFKPQPETLPQNSPYFHFEEKKWQEMIFIVQLPETYIVDDRII